MVLLKSTIGGCEFVAFCRDDMRCDVAVVLQCLVVNREWPRIKVQRDVVGLNGKNVWRAESLRESVEES